MWLLFQASSIIRHISKLSIGWTWGYSKICSELVVHIHRQFQHKPGACSFYAVDGRPLIIAINLTNNSSSLNQSPCFTVIYFVWVVGLRQRIHLFYGFGYYILQYDYSWINYTANVRNVMAPCVWSAKHYHKETHYRNDDSRDKLLHCTTVQ